MLIQKTKIRKNNNSLNSKEKHSCLNCDLVGLSNLGVMCSFTEPRFTRSNQTEVDRFFRT